MCGRFANQLESKEAWEEYFGTPLPAEFLEEVVIGYNIAPTQMIPVVIGGGGSDDDGCHWLATRWGMIGPWVKDASEISSKFATFNARLETVSEKATFRGAWSAGRRCIIPAIGYYEWKTTDDGKQPYFVRHVDETPLCFGGLYEPARNSTSGAGVPASCTIITQPASDQLASLHARMPLMFGVQGIESWLNEGEVTPEVSDLHFHAVSKTVNNTRNQGIELIQCEK